MSKLSDSSIIVIVIVVCLALVSLGAALTKQFWPEAPQQRYNYPAEQQSYMRTVRLKNLGIFQRESMNMSKAPAPVARDVESGYSENESSHY
ncbi:hypothetical protein BO78DRAFT_398979 [Aspergillus sclerotiicarbonarius CBS 121057]|uniref:Uncharacterized protein n=1 Tax=Aspergillus sclerotiicarbonarius (strain CBS 121057 / IBT 28362) TaxID=1448318 RepID=A0A319E856_ASPSB|nr:hypothetical protein BO78DRAFT_398979 [Aspergillus sclerotiicarbonarius CBS 121057]